MQKENKKISKIISVEMFYQNISTKSKGFTLVELIIVITILAILSTIAYISFQGYTKDARDGARMSDIKQIYNGLSIYKTQTEKTLLPDNYINIQSGTTTISYQGYAGASVLRTLKISGGKDPGTKDYYIYTTDANTKKAQLMTYMETSDKNVQLLSKIFVNKVLALTNTGYYQDKKIYVYGDKIGILTDTNKVPLQEITTATGINIIISSTPITTYFGGNVYSGGLSTNTGLTLINQINGAVNGTLPCNPETYNGYTITSLQDSQTGTFIKAIPVVNGSQTGTLNISCSNGKLNHTTEIETLSSIVCNSSYILSSGNCILNATAPTNFSLTQTTNSKLFNISFSGGTNNGTCKLQYENSGSWIDITSGVSMNCDTNINNIQYSLNGDGWKSSWNNTQVRLLRVTDNQVLKIFTQNLLCTITTGNASSTPNIDEDCDGTWDNSTTTNYSCGTGKSCYKIYNYYYITGNSQLPCGNTPNQSWLSYGCYPDNVGTSPTSPAWGNGGVYPSADRYGWWISRCADRSVSEPASFRMADGPGNNTVCYRNPYDTTADACISSHTWRNAPDHTMTYDIKKVSDQNLCAPTGVYY